MLSAADLFILEDFWGHLILPLLQGLGLVGVFVFVLVVIAMARAK